MPMLVLTRREGEEVVLVDSRGNEIARARVTSIRDDRVRIAWEAPLTLGVHRAEMWEKAKAERAASDLVVTAGAAA